MDAVRRHYLFFALIQGCVGTVSALTAGTYGEAYPMCFMNITGGGGFIDYGFFQIYGISANDTHIRVAALTSNVNEFGTVDTERSTFNYSRNYDEVSFKSPNDESGNEETGIIASSDHKAFFVGVKSDKGSTDAFQAMPVVKTSKEFFVAAWPYKPPFSASCMVIPALSRTCVEMYKFFPDGSAIMIASTSLNQYETFRYFASTSLNSDGTRNSDSYEDVTGYFINATKPVQVICGHECANVPLNILFCDHMVEQIPPKDQLGKEYIVPPIYGRSANAGYIVRVVANYNFTQVTWTSSSLGQNSKTLRLGEFTEIVTTATVEPLKINCNQSCLVMQYNKGKRAAVNDVPSDPFMMLTIPNDHFSEDAGFGTPNYCDEAKLRINFDNWVTIVTTIGTQNNIRFNNKVLSLVTTSQWDTTSVSGYAIVSFRIPHGFHYVYVSPPGSGTFACYVYGHSILDTSSSAYGFSANYKIIGDPVTEVWIQSLPSFNQYLNSLKNETCANEIYFTGDYILNDTNVPFPFVLSASFTPVSMSDKCFEYYNQSLWIQLTNLTRLINYWICTTQNCSYLDGEGVVINYATLAVQFQKNSQGLYSGVVIRVEMAASLETTFVGFATCRVEVKNFMQKFINWPSGLSYLISPPPSSLDCPKQLKFADDNFITNNEDCPAG